MAHITIKRLVTPVSHWTTNYSVTVEWSKDEVITGPMADPLMGWNIKTLKDGRRKLVNRWAGYNADTVAKTQQHIAQLSGCATTVELVDN